MIEPLPAKDDTTSPWWYAAAAILAALLAGGYALTLRTHIGFLDQAIREGRAQTQAAQRQLNDVQQQLRRAQAGASQGQVIAILSATDIVSVDLKVEAAAARSGPRPTGRAFWSASAGLLATAATLPPLPAAQAYQLWVEPASGQPFSAGVLSPDPAGSAVLAAAPFAERPAGFVVTIEPAGGATSPGGARVLAGTR